MAITVNLQVEVSTSGDGETSSDVFNWLPNSNAPRSPSKFLVNGASTINVPTNAKGMLVLAPSAAGTYTVKGVSGDTGVTITAGGILACRFGTLPTTVVLYGSVSGLWTIYWA